jgi:protoporphyrinogen oxidase
MSAVVVVGGGLSGLAAAYRLHQAGVQVTVLERGPNPGGRAQTERHGGYLVDTGPDALTESYHSYLGLLRELGLGDRVVPSSPVVGLVRRGKLIDIDPKRPWTLLRDRPLGPGAVVRLLRGYRRLRGVLADVDSYQLVKSTSHDDPDRSAYDLALEHFGQEVTDYLIDPVMRLTTGSGAREASWLNVLGALNSWTVPLINIKGGLGVLPAALAAEVPVVYGATVTGIDETGSPVTGSPVTGSPVTGSPVSGPDETGGTETGTDQTGTGATTGGVTVGYTDADGRHHELNADGCVIGAMYHDGVEVWPELKRVSEDFADHLRNVKLISVSLGYRVPTASRAYAVQLPTVEDKNTLLIFLQHNKAPDRVPDGHSLVTIYTDTLVTDSYLARADTEIVEWAAGVVESLCPELAGRRDLEVVTRWPKAGYLATPGFWRRSAALLDALPADGPVQVAGDLFGAGSMESAVRWGEVAAQRLITRLSRNRTSEHST